MDRLPLSYIKVYLMNNIVGWIIGRGGWRIKSIERDTFTTILHHNREIDSYFSIEGSYKDVHKARVILQDLERAYYER